MSILNEIEDVVNEMLIEATKNNKSIVDSFFRNQFPKTAEEALKQDPPIRNFQTVWGPTNLKLTRVPADAEEKEVGWGLFFNQIPIAFRPTGSDRVYYNSKPTGTTSISKVQGTINKFLGENPELDKSVTRTSKDALSKIVKSPESADSILKTLGDTIQEPKVEPEATPEVPAEIPTEIPAEMPSEAPASEEVPEETPTEEELEKPTEEENQ